MNSSSIRPIKEAISSTLEELGLCERLKQCEVLERWHEIVGDQIAQVTVVDHIDDGKLFVIVRRAPWRNELIFLKKKLIVMLNQAMHSEVVKDIIFR